MISIVIPIIVPSFLGNTVVITSATEKQTAIKEGQLINLSNKQQDWYAGIHLSLNGLIIIFYLNKRQT